jgi:hypothetical protein
MLIENLKRSISGSLQQLESVRLGFVEAHKFFSETQKQTGK